MYVFYCALQVISVVLATVSDYRLCIQCIYFSTITLQII